MFKNLAVGIVGEKNNISIIGAKRILEEYKIPFDIVSETEIAELIINYPVLMFSSKISLSHFNYLNKFLKSGGCLIYYGILDSQGQNLLNIRIKDKIINGKFKLKFRKNNPIINNIEKREILIMGKMALINECKEYEVIGTFTHDDQNYPAIIISRIENIIYIPFDICSQVILWENEQYSEPQEKTFIKKFIVAKYAIIPFRFRKFLKLGARKARRILSNNRTIYTNCPIEYNSDTIRMLVFNSIIYLFLRNSVVLPSLGKWPKNYKGAMVITHDVDTDEDYEKGLPILLKIEKKYNINQLFTF